MQVRRIVTGIDEQGKSTVKSDVRIDPVAGRAGFQRFDLWCTDSLPPRRTEESPDLATLGTSVPNGSVFRIAQYDPGVEGRWHTTETIDYGVVLSGELWMQLDDGEVHLQTGDVVVQRGTAHNWVNRGTERCVMVFVLIATEGARATGW